MLTSKLIDGSFPDYARVIPAANKKALILQTADLVKAVDRVSTLSSEKGRAVKLEVGETSVVVSASNPDSGSAEEEITRTNPLRLASTRATCSISPVRSTAAKRCLCLPTAPRPRWSPMRATIPRFMC